MKKKILIIIGLIVLFLIFLTSGIYLYQQYRIAHAIIKVNLIDSLEVEVYSKIRLKDFIQNINGKIDKNFTIDTSTLGTKKISFYYTNEENIKVPYEFKIKVVDKTPPIISMYDTYYMTLGYEGNLEKELFCGDNYDDHPTCKIEGEINPNIVGSYPVTYHAIDSSHNEIFHHFTVHVTEKTSGDHSKEEVNTTPLQHVINTYKNAHTKIGIDISHWQGDIDFQTVKESGVEFAFIRVGSQKGIGGEYVLDEMFKKNMEGFIKVGIPVGVYFYTYADSKEESIKQAKWVLKQIRKYKVSLPIVYDWENWDFYQEFGLSFYHLTEMANAFLDTVKKNGYEGMLYSSKNYLENMWMKTNYKIWLAHYTAQTNYQGDYQVWQLCNNGVVDGINDHFVDIDVMY